ncbi:hypothetical protein LOK49_LG13G00472 [Camellia lanceoleosa]|uniref:Uncharacterized protein n=1 Tax=Camellia lanceoleosa TaxID=1840588 RepID=A0ACC0FGI0_9ERIC|nr:hypothetical protein LOK49_LG13G00472 [Camellia lanceoleosa]
MMMEVQSTMVTKKDGGSVNNDVSLGGRGMQSVGEVFSESGMKVAEKKQKSFSCTKPSFPNPPPNDLSITLHIPHHQHHSTTSIR